MFAVAMIVGGAARAAAADGAATPTRAGQSAATTAFESHDPAAASAADDAKPKGTAFALPRHAIAGGGGSSSGGAFAISGTIGQSDADPLHPATGGVFALTGGFWPGIAPDAPAGDPIFANGFEPAPP